MSAPDLPPITLRVMRHVVLTLAEDIEAEQERYVRFGYRTRPDPAKLEEARVLRKIGELIERIGKDGGVLARLGVRATAAGDDGI